MIRCSIFFNVNCSLIAFNKGKLFIRGQIQQAGNLIAVVLLLGKPKQLPVGFLYKKSRLVICSIWSNQRHFLNRLICDENFLPTVFLSQLIRCPLLGVDSILPGGIVDAAHGVHIAARCPVLPEILACHSGAVVKPDGKLTITVGVDVFCVAAFQHLAAGFLPAVACHRDAEREGIAVRRPGSLGPVADSVFQGGIGPGTLDQAADAVGVCGG